MAGAPTLPKENVNYIRLQLLVSTFGTKGLRDVFDHCPTFRPAVLQGTLHGNQPLLKRLKNDKCISAYQWDILFPPDGSMPLSSQFDITLCVLLLRNLGRLGNPSGFQWDKLPAAADIAIYHDVARLKYYRNKYAHAAPIVSDGDFLNDWKDIESAILRIVPAAGLAQYTANIKDLLSQALSQDDLVKILDHIKNDQQASRNEASGYTTDIKKKIGTSTDEVKDGIATIKDQIGTSTADVKDGIATIKDQIGTSTTDVKNHFESRFQELRDVDNFQNRSVPESLDSLGEELKKNYKQKFQKVQSLSSIGVPSMFEVISKLFVDLDRTPLEIRCSNFGKQQTTSTPKTQVKVDTTEDITNLLTDVANPNMLPIMIEADAGVGKTTLLHRLTYYWVKGLKDMDKFKLVFLIPLRNVRSNRLEDIICDDLKLIKEKNKPDLKRFLDEKGDETLFLLDGLDEVQLWPGCELKELLKGEETYICCSSRPRMVEKNFDVPQFMSVKLLGFSDETLVRYINLYFIGDDDTQHNNMADQLIAECRKHFFCKALIRIPLYAGIFCYLWNRHMGRLPDTATKLFNQCIMEVLNTYSKRNQLPQEKPPQITFKNSPLELSVSAPIRRLLACISKLAYKTLMSETVAETVSFSLDLVDEFQLSLKDVTDIGLFNIEDEGAVICFRHKLFHEYFAGLYLTEHKKKISELFATKMIHEILSGTHILQKAFFFAGGMSEEAFKYTVNSLNSNKEVDGGIGLRIESHRYKRSDEISGTIGEQITIQGYDPLVFAFYLQLLFERNAIADSLDMRIRGIRMIPVNCASVHSLAAALHVLEMQKEDDSTDTTPKLLVLIDGPILDIDQLNTILEECNSRPDITHIRLMRASDKLISSVLELKWEHIRGVEFEKSQYILPFKDFVSSFPNIESIVYDYSTWKNGRMFLKGNESIAADRVFLKCSCIFFQCMKNLYAMAEDSLTQFPLDCLCIRIGVDKQDKDWLVGREYCLPKNVTDVSIEKQTSHESFLCPWRCPHSSDSYLKSIYKILSIENIVRVNGECLSITERCCLNKSTTNYVLEYYSQKARVKTLLPPKWGKACIDAILSVEWPYIERIEFVDCEVLIPVSMLADRFPKLRYVLYDLDTQNKGKPLEKECITKHNEEIIVQLSSLSSYSVDMCKLCTKNHPNSRQIMVPLESSANEAFTDCLFRDSVIAVCINRNYDTMGLNIDPILTTIKQVDTVYMHFDTKPKEILSVDILYLKKYKKVSKMTRSVLQRGGDKRLASIEFFFPYMPYETHLPDMVTLSYDEMIDVCGKGNRIRVDKRKFSWDIWRKQVGAIKDKLVGGVECSSQFFICSDMSVAMTFKRFS